MDVKVDNFYIKTRKKWELLLYWGSKVTNVETRPIKLTNKRNKWKPIRNKRVIHSVSWFTEADDLIFIACQSAEDL
jgi:hypothetical protein